MNIPENYILDLSSNGSILIPNDIKIIFLCGVKFDRKNDKRIALKNYLQKTPEHRVIILEEHFSNTSIYGSINLKNLYDVETLVGCFSNATIIIHESISTGTELGMLASNKSTASKLLILHPDRDSVEENKISSFIFLAYYSGENPVLSHKSEVTFNPVLSRSYDTNDRYTYHTSFPNDLKLESYTRNEIDSFLNITEVQPISKISFSRTKFHDPTEEVGNIDYYLEEDTINFYISPMALRCLLFSLLCLDHVKSHVEESTSISIVMTSLIEDLNKLLINTSRSKLGLDLDNVRIRLKGLALSTFHDESTDEVRKAIGLFIYLIKAMGYLADEDDKKFKITNHFVDLRNKFDKTITIAKKTAFEKHMESMDARYD